MTAVCSTVRAQELSGTIDPESASMNSAAQARKGRREGRGRKDRGRGGRREEGREGGEEEKK